MSIEHKQKRDTMKPDDTIGIAVLERLGVCLIGIVRSLNRGLTVPIGRPLNIEGGRAAIRGTLDLKVRVTVRSALNPEVAVTVGRTLDTEVSFSPSL